MLKSAASIYVHPLTIAMELIVLGVVLVGFSRRQKRKPPGRFGAWMRRFAGDSGVGLIITGIFFLFLCSISPVADPLVFGLEKKYPPLPIDLMTDVERKEVAPDFIVVLGGGERFDPGKPPTSQLSYAAMARVTEGSRLAGIFPKATVVFTGLPNETRAMTESAMALGVSKDRIVTESESKDTWDHPKYVRPIIGDAKFFLVTSGTHMPRAMALFEAAGYQPVAAPCDLWVWPAFGQESPYQPTFFIPTVENLWKTHVALHEYLALTWLKMHGGEGSEPQLAEEKEPSVDHSADGTLHPEPASVAPAVGPVLPLPGAGQGEGKKPVPGESKTPAEGEKDGSVLL